MTAVPPNDEQFIRQLLDESGVGTSLPLQASLLEMRAAGTAPAPEPSAELAAFMTPAVVPLRRRRRTTKGLVIGLAVAAATGLGVSGVAAANPQFHAAADQAVRHVVGIFAPAAGPDVPAPPAPAATTSDGGDQARPAPTKTRVPDKESSGSAATGTAPATGAGHGNSEHAARPGQDPAKIRDALPSMPELPVPSGLPVPGGERSAGPGLKVPPVPRPTGPADLPELPVLPAGPDH